MRNVILYMFNYITQKGTNMTATHTDIQLGNLVEDIATGYSGRVTRKAYGISGSIQFCVVPPAKDGVFPDGTFIDYHTLVVSDPGIADVLPQMAELPEWLKLGVRAKDKYSDFKGVVTMMCYEMNGCVTVMVSAEKLDRNDKINIEGFNMNSIELFEERKMMPLPKPKESRTGPPPVTGRSVPRNAR